jgi:anti-sigma factor ChrR (cupin superfamily)
MNKPPSDDTRAQAALYALGALDGAEAAEFERRLAAGDAECHAELDAFRATAADLAYGAEAQPPPPALRARLLERIAAVEAPVVEQDGLRFVRSGRLDWQAYPQGEVETKLLFGTPDGRRTHLVRVPPGGSLPPHRHTGVEEIYLIEGDMEVAGFLMRSGDYCRAEPGSVHDGIRTTAGCVFIITASAPDELLA